MYRTKFDTYNKETQKSYDWSVIFGYGSYGQEKKKLECMSDYYDTDDGIIGSQTADEIIKAVKESIGIKEVKTMSEIIINKEQHECPPAVAAYIKELKAENTRLEELYQKSVGVIAATDCEECKNKVYSKAYNDVMKIRANIQEIIEDVCKKDGGADDGCKKV